MGNYWKSYISYLQLPLVDHGLKKVLVEHLQRLLAFILINRITGAIFGVSADMLADSTATVKSLFGARLIVPDYFTSVLGSPALKYGCVCWYYFRFLRSSII